MVWAPIRKDRQAGGFNLADYEAVVREFLVGTDPCVARLASPGG
jgi:hypothetical protein